MVWARLSFGGQGGSGCSRTHALSETTASREATETLIRSGEEGDGEGRGRGGEGEGRGGEGEGRGRGGKREGGRRGGKWDG